MLCWIQWWEGPNNSETHNTHAFSLPSTSTCELHSLPSLGLSLFSMLKTPVGNWKKNLRGGLTLQVFLHWKRFFICVRFSSAGVMPQCFSVLFGAVLVVLVAGNVGPNQDRRQAGSSSCFGGFDLYFVLDKWVSWHTSPDTFRMNELDGFCWHLIHVKVYKKLIYHF